MSEVSRRIHRVEKELRHLVAGYFLTGLKHRPVCLASVTQVKVSPDLRYAKVFVSLLGEASDKASDWELIKGQLSFIQRYVGQNLKLKFTPRLQLFLDKSADEVEKIQRILHEIEKGNSDSMSGAIPNSEKEEDGI